MALFAGTDRETGYPVSPMRRALQTATRAFGDGADDEMVFAVLFHDIGDRISPINHARMGAELLRRYVGERAHWILAHHNICQGHYYWHRVGRDRNAREKYRGHPRRQPPPCGFGESRALVEPVPRHQGLTVAPLARRTREMLWLFD